ncbi:MAG: hypothetical protein WD097_09770 [Balneolales bacterium]
MNKLLVILSLAYLLNISFDTNNQHLFWGVDVLNPESYKWESVIDILSEEWGADKEAVKKALGQDYYQLSDLDKSLEEPFITFDAVTYYPEQSYHFEKAVEDDAERKLMFDQIEDYLTNRLGDSTPAIGGLMWNHGSPEISYVSLDEVDDLVGVGIDGKGIRVGIIL